MQNHSDHELILKIAQGDSKAFSSLLLRHQKKIFGLCYYLMNDAALAEDVAQETWIRVVQYAPKYSPIASVSAWMSRIARNLCINELKKRNRWSDLEPDDEAQIKDEHESVESMMEQIQQQQKLDFAMSLLPAQQKMALMIYLVEDKSHSEIAQEMDMSVGAVKVLLFRARQQLKKTLEGL
ncbi:sigma-70 family RNA polymerase sigma factor [bacterium]|nr:sigma-70 family RNA polymerase sigma factor [bacterium]